MHQDPLWDVITQTIESKEYIDGRNARFNDFKQDDNPYVELAFIEEHWELNATGENVNKVVDWRRGWINADKLKAKIADIGKNYVVPIHDQFVIDLNLLLKKYDIELISVDTDRGFIEFKEGYWWNYEFATQLQNGNFRAMRPVGG